MDYTVQGILQAIILEWVAFPFSRGSSQPRDRTQVSHLERTIADKEEIIKARDARIAELERQLVAANNSDLSRYPFRFGSAEDQKDIIY